MICTEVAIEAIAAGELMPDTAIAEHLSTCAACTVALEEARLVDSFLRARPAPIAPAQFTSRTMSRIRRASWRREQTVDWIFNAGMIATALLAAVGLWIAVQRSGLSFTSREAMDIFSLGLATMVLRVSPSLPLYAGAAGLLIAALGFWWWAERDSLT
jgi:anti-sigma factor RsiW